MSMNKEKDFGTPASAATEMVNLEKEKRGM